MNPLTPDPSKGNAEAEVAAQRRRRVQRRLDAKTKPLGALGRLEALAVQLAVALDTDHPRLHAPQVLVCAADHGLAAQGVSAYPAEVTGQMVANMLAGGAAISVLARQHGLALTVVDCGVKGSSSGALQAPISAGDALPGRPRRVQAWLGPGTRDASAEPAMDEATARRALDNGAALVRSLPGNALLLGEMGIGNTSAASLLMARLTGEPLERCVGRGTGLDDAALARKQQVLHQVLVRHAEARTPLAALAALGGFEIATLAGAVLQATVERRAVVVDGFITTAAVAVAVAMQPEVLSRCVFSHASAESGHALWLRHLGVQPLLDLGLRLGEGSGAALAWPLLQSACHLLDEMASFEAAGVSTRAPSAGHPGTPP